MKPEHRAYYQGRGLTDETIDKHMLGYAPQEKRWLTERLWEQTDNRKIEQFLGTGLFFKNGNNTLQDRYQHRYVIPYWRHGQIVYSTGRTADTDEEKKYVKHLVRSENYPFVSDTAIQHILWGEGHIREDTEVLVTEGIIDALLADQEFGRQFTVVSPGGTQWTHAQIERLCQATCRVKSITFVTDADKHHAGEEGALRSATKIKDAWQELTKDKPDLFNQYNTEPQLPTLKIARLRRPPDQDKTDLADYIASGKIKELQYWIESAQSIEYEEARINRSPERFFLKEYGFTPKLVADEIKIDGADFKYTNSQLHRYNDGKYTPDGLEYIHHETQKRLGELTQIQRRDEVYSFIEVETRIQNN